MVERNGGRIRRMADGSLIISPPAALAAGQAPPPAGQPERPQPVAQVVINVPLSKLSAFLDLVEEWMTDEVWAYRAPGL